MKKRSTLMVAAFVAAFSLVAGSAMATHTVTWSITLDPTTHDTYANSTSTTDYGTEPPASSTTHLPPGHKLAQQSGTSPITPIPNDNDQVGDGVAHYKIKPFCTSATTNYTVKWESDMSGAPTDAVSHLKIVSSIITLDAWILRKTSGDSVMSGDHYDIYVPSYGGLACKNKAADGTSETYGTVAGTNRVVHKNPASAGTYTAELRYTDEDGGNHSASDSYSVT